MSSAPFADVCTRYHNEVVTRLTTLDERARSGEYDSAIAVLTECIAAGNVIHSFGTGHSEAFAMELAGRAGGLIPTNKVALRDAVKVSQDEVGTASSLERDPNIAAALWDTVPVHPGDVFVIASNSGVNGSVVGFALLAKQAGHTVIAVTSLEHTAAVTPLHPSGQRLSEIADIVIDNLAPFGDGTLDVGVGVPVGSVSSITAAYIAQLLTLGVALQLRDRGVEVPLYLSANIPDGRVINSAIEDRYQGRIRRRP